MQTIKIFRIISVLAFIALLVASLQIAGSMKSLKERNNYLILQNDSILSVNLKLEKEISKMEQRMDSLVVQFPASFQ